LFTTFDDAATRPITSGSAPFRGAYRPEVPLSSLAGQNARGDWYLAVIDVVRGGAGTLASWSLTIQAASAKGIVESGSVTTVNTLVAGVSTANDPTSDEFITTPVAQRGARLVTAEGGATLRLMDAESIQVKADTSNAEEGAADEPSWLRCDLPGARD
jgi:hypothetical protein